MEMKLINIIIEGNIAAGKSKLLESIESNPDVVVMSEPLEAWRNYNGCNMFELMYKEPKKYMEEFQLMIIKTASENHNAIVSKKIKIRERSIFSSHFIFSRVALEDGNLNNEQFDNIHRHFMDLTKRMVPPNYIIYLRTDPAICYARLKMRNRQEENSVSLEYIKTIHMLYEKLFINEQYLLPGIVIVLNGDDKRDDVSKKCINFIQTFGYKRCSKCHFFKTHVDFDRYKDRLQNYCKDCKRETKVHEQ